MSVLCFAPLHPYIYISSICCLSFVHINHLFMYVKLCFIEVSINATLKLIIQACSSRHFLVFKHKGKILPGFHFHNHNAYVSVKPSMKLLRKIANLCTIVVISKFLHIAITFDHISIIFSYMWHYWASPLDEHIHVSYTYLKTQVLGYSRWYKRSWLWFKLVDLTKWILVVKERLISLTAS